MDWSQIVALLSDIVFLLFTGVLAFATIGLWRSTNRYAGISQLDFHDRLFIRFYPGLELETTEGPLVQKIYEKHLKITTKKEVVEAYRALLRNQLDKINKEFPDDDAQ